MSWFYPRRPLASFVSPSDAHTVRAMPAKSQALLTHLWGELSPSPRLHTPPEDATWWPLLARTAEAGIRHWRWRAHMPWMGRSEQGGWRPLSSQPLPPAVVHEAVESLGWPRLDPPQGETAVVREQGWRFAECHHFADQSTLGVSGEARRSDQGEMLLDLRFRHRDPSPVLGMGWPMDLHQRLRARVGKLTLVTADTSADQRLQLEGIMAMAAAEGDTIGMFHDRAHPWPGTLGQAHAYETTPDLRHHHPRRNEILVVDQLNDEGVLLDLQGWVLQHQSCYAAVDGGCVETALARTIACLCYEEPACLLGLFRSLHLVVAQRWGMAPTGEAVRVYAWLEVDAAFLQALAQEGPARWRATVRAAMLRQHSRFLDQGWLCQSGRLTWAALQAVEDPDTLG